MWARRPAGIMFAVVFSLVAVSIVYAALSTSNLKPALEGVARLEPEDDGWTCLLPGGSAPAVPGSTLDGVGDALTVRREVFPEELRGGILLFRNNRQSVTVLADGEPVFRLGGGERRFKLSATGYCAVRLPQKGRAYTLEIVFSHLSGGRCKLPEFYFGSYNDVLIFLGEKDLVVLSAIPVWLILGVVLAALGIFIAYKKIPERRVISMSVFLLFAAVWDLAELSLLCLCPVDMELVNTISNFMTMLLPIPTLFFIVRSCPHRQAVMHKAFFAVLMGNAAVQSLLFLLGVASLHQMVPISQALLILMLFYGVGCVVLDYRTAPTPVGAMQVAGFSVTAVLGAAVVLVYWLQGSGGLYRAVFQAAVLVFLTAMMGVLFCSLDHQNNVSRKKDQEIAAYRTISTVDQLTGLGNRRAFDRRLQEICGDPERFPNAVLVFMDLNGLKYANDVFGHRAGDELIAAAAGCIRRGFDGAGSAFRVGGDEFAAVLPGLPAAACQCCARMDRAIEEYNAGAKVPLGIARGSCPLVTEEGVRLSVSNWKEHADKLMYQDKLARKHSRYRGGAEAACRPGGDTDNGSGSA